MELISIVIPVYNVEQYVERCIKSVLKQNYENIEIIIVNDGSTDNSGLICEQYSKSDSRIKLIQKSNGGLSDARNVGIENSKGKYITFLDSDDWVAEDYIKILYNLLKDSDADISICDFKYTSINHMEKRLNAPEIKEFSNLEALDQLMGNLSVQFTIACGKMYKIELFKDIRFPLERLHEDEFTVYKLLYKSKKVIYTSDKLLYYWQRSDSITQRARTLKQEKDKLEALIERAEFFSSVGLTEFSKRTYKVILFIFLNNNTYERILIEASDKDEYIDLSNKIRNSVRSSKHNTVLKILSEFYFISPVFVQKCYKLYKNLKK